MNFQGMTISVTAADVDGPALDGGGPIVRAMLRGGIGGMTQHDISVMCGHFVFESKWVYLPDRQTRIMMQEHAAGILGRTSSRSWDEHDADLMFVGKIGEMILIHRDRATAIAAVLADLYASLGY